MKIIKSVLAITASVLFVCILVLSFAVFSADKLTSEQEGTLNQYSPELVNSSGVLELSKTEAFDEFVADLEDEYALQKQEDMENILEKYKSLGIDISDTLAELAKKSQEYLDSEFDGLTLDSTEYGEIFEKEAYLDGGVFYELHNDDEPEDYDLNLVSLYVYNQFYCASAVDTSEQENLDSSIEDLYKIIYENYELSDELIIEILKNYTDDYQYVDFTDIYEN